MRLRATVTVGITGLALVAGALATGAPASAAEREHPGSTVGRPPATAPGTATPAAEGGQIVDSISRGDTLSPGDQIVSTGFDNPGTDETTSYFGTRVVVQDDGNLVEYLNSTGAALWSSGTAGAGPATLRFQDDGNVVLYNEAGEAIWSTLTYGTNAQFFYPYGNGTVVVSDGQGVIFSVYGPAVAGEFGRIYSFGFSPNRTYQLIVQDDGNVVAYADGQAYWSTGTNGAGPVSVITQGDGNFVVYQASTGRALWQSGSTGQGSGATQLDIQDDGNIVLYGILRGVRVIALWQSGTVR